MITWLVRIFALMLGLTLVAAGCTRKQPIYGDNTRTIQSAPAPVVVPQAPPDPVPETVGPVPNPSLVRVPGRWAWQGRWIWIPGSWAVPPHPKAKWAAGYWSHRKGGYVWVPGHWK
jgi:hypothetical protein